MKIYNLIICGFIGKKNENMIIYNYLPLIVSYLLNYVCQFNFYFVDSNCLYITHMLCQPLLLRLFCYIITTTLMYCYCTYYYSLVASVQVI